MLMEITIWHFLKNIETRKIIFFSWTVYWNKIKNSDNFFFFWKILKLEFFFPIFRYFFHKFHDWKKFFRHFHLKISADFFHYYFWNWLIFFHKKSGFFSYFLLFQKNFWLYLFPWTLPKLFFCEKFLKTGWKKIQ